MSSQDEMYDRLYKKFDVDMHDMVRAEKQSNRLTESGQPRIALRALVNQLMKTAEIQLDTNYQIKLSLYFATEFYNCGEMSLAIECNEIAQSKCDLITDNLIATKYKVESVQNIAKSYIFELLKVRYIHITPMSVSKLLLCLQRLRQSLDHIFDLSVKEQEDMAYSILNSCKLIIEIAQPLVLLNCGKYVTETLLYAALCLDSTINLCTVRHMKFRMKFYSTAFYSVIAQGSLDEANAIIARTNKQFLELKEREEIDPPVPQNSQLCIENCGSDIAVMKLVLDFWKDPDSLNLDKANLDKYFVSKNENRSFVDNCLCECIRVHLLTSGNVNETYRKRTQSILKAVGKVIANYVIIPEEEISDENPNNKINSDIISNFSIYSLFEVANIAVFDSVEGIDTVELLTKICSIVDIIIRTTGDQITDYSGTEYSKYIDILKSLFQFTQSSDESNKNIAVKSILSQLEELLFVEKAYRRKAFLRKISLFVWTKYLYPLLQENLSKLDIDSNVVDSMITTSESVIKIVKSFDVTYLEDPVFVGSLSIVSANLLWFAKEQRQAISILKEAIVTIEDHRAAYVDVSLHMPEDVRDIFALQRSSFTARSEALDWFHSFKRLGAHAFAGFGIFGLSSSSDRTLQAMAEIHTDLVVLYIRYELEHGLYQRAIKINHKTTKDKSIIINPAIGKTLDFSKPQKKNKTGKGSGTATAKSATKTIKNETRTNSTENIKTMISGEVNLENLAALSMLKSFTLRNSYYRCILFLELARLEKNEEKCLEYLHDALKSIEEAEGHEEMLKLSFTDFTVVTLNKKKQYPIVVARSHKYIYVSPVACRQLSKALYYRVFAKERGSGTDISIYNTDYAGCEKKVGLQHLTNPTAGAVRIGPLRAGELYVFGSAAFSGDDKVIGHVSDSTPMVEAVNPLPTIMLWKMLNKTAEDLSLTISTGRIYREAALRVCDRFLMKCPKFKVISVNKGNNLFLFPECSISMLSIQQSSPLIVHNFIDSFLSYETQSKVGFEDSGLINWNFRKHFQYSNLVSLQRTSYVAYISSLFNFHEQTVRCVTLGYSFAYELLRFDLIHLSHMIQNPLTSFILSLQTIPKCSWKDLEHTLYCRIFADLIKVSVYNKNLSPVLLLFENFYPELLNNTTENNIPLNSVVTVEYLVLFDFVQKTIPSNHLFSFTNQIKAIFPNLSDENYSKEENDGVGYFWKITDPQRFIMLQKVAADLSCPADKMPATRTQLYNYLSDTPYKESDYFKVILQLMKELITDNRSQEMYGLLQRLPIYFEYVSPKLQAIHDDWKLNLFIPLSAKVTAPVVDANAKGGKGGKGKVEEVVAPVVEEKVPDRFINCSAEEENDQFQYLAEIFFLIASTYFNDSKTVNKFPSSKSGPLMVLQPSDDISLTPPETKEPITDSSSPSRSLFNLPIDKLTYATFVGASIELFCNSGKVVSAIQVALSFWNYLNNEWYDAITFANQFYERQNVILSILRSLVFGLETMVQLPSSSSTADTDDWLTLQEQKEHLLLIRDFLTFLIKVEWLFKEYEEVVLIGSRIFNLYSVMCPEYCKTYGDSCLPLITHSQQQLINAAQSILDEKTNDLNSFVHQYEEAQKKKRKKKLRVAKVEKDEEELLFDAERAVYEEKVNEAKSFLETRQLEIENVLEQQKNFNVMYSSGSQLLDKARKATKIFLSDLHSQFGDDSDLRNCLEDEGINMKLKALLKQYSQVNNNLRDTKERVLLMDGLKAQGDLLLLFGKIAEVRQIWHDAVDGLFNAIDACVDWKNVCDKAIKNPDYEIIVGTLPVMIVLGKLSKYCVSNDWDTKSGYCRMAAELSKIIFSESFGHPETSVGYATYFCVEIGGTNALSLDWEVISAQGFASSMQEILSVLIAEKELIIALPVVTLLEHFYAMYLCSPTLWLSARLMRIRLLIESHLFSEASSMISIIQPMINAIHRQSLCDVTRNTFLSEMVTVTSFDLSKNGLNFNGTPEFFNNIPPHDEVNAKALKWISDYCNDFELFAGKFKINLPIPILSEEEKKAQEEKLAALAKEAEEAAKKSKGKKTTEIAPPIVDNLQPTAPLFTPFHIIEIQINCSHYLFEISQLDDRLSSIYSEALKNYSTIAVNLLAKAIKSLNSIYDENSLKNKLWISLYGRCIILQSNYLISKKSYKEARAMTTSFLNLLKSDEIKELSGDSRGEISQLWFQTKSLIILLTERQARFVDVIILSTKSAKEASSLCSGFWLRKFIFYRSKSYFKTGDFEKSLIDCESCIKNFTTTKVKDLLLVQCLCLQASVIREMNFLGNNSQSMFLNCIDILWQARNLAEELSVMYGGYLADNNTTYNNDDTAILKHQRNIPKLFNLTEKHFNEPDLFIPPRIDQKKLLQNYSIHIPHNSLNIQPLVEKLRLGPVDVNETTYASSNLVNIYLLQIRSLLICCSDLCKILNDARNSNAFTNEIVSLRVISEEMEENNEEESYSCNLSSLLEEEILIGESGLKLLRHCVYAPVQVRIALLYSTGCTRLAKPSNCDGDQKVMFSPFNAALDIAIKSSHPWNLMKRVCVQMVESYGDNSVEFEEDSFTRLTIAVKYLVTAIKINNQYLLLTSNPVTLSNDDSFSVAPPADLLQLILSSFSSSSTNDFNQAANDEPVVAAGKGAPPPKAAKGGGPAAGTGVANATISGRDALFLLSSLQREVNHFWCDGFEEDVSSDIHFFLKSAYPLYKSKCTLDKLPDVTEQINVPISAVSTLWNPVKQPESFLSTVVTVGNGLDYSKSGAYTHVSVFFLLGDKASISAVPTTVPTGKGGKVDPTANATTVSKEPVLTKLILPRVDLTFIEKKLRDLRDKLIDAQIKKLQSLVSSYNEQAAVLIIMLIDLLRVGIIAFDTTKYNVKFESNDYKYNIVEDTTNNTFTVEIQSNHTSSSIKIILTEKLLLNISNAISPELSMDSIVDNDLCSLVRLGLGYN